MCWITLIIREVSQLFSMSFSDFLFLDKVAIQAACSPAFFACLQVSPCFLQLHLAVEQSCLQQHLMTFKRYSGAGSKSVMIGIRPPSRNSHPQSSGSMSGWPSVAHSWTWQKARFDWKPSVAGVMGRSLAWTALFLFYMSFWSYMTRQKRSSESEVFPPYFARNALSPAAITSWLLLLGSR